MSLSINHLRSIPRPSQPRRPLAQRSLLACCCMVALMIGFITATPSNLHAHPLDFAVITLKASDENPNKITLVFQLNSNNIIPLSEQITPPAHCSVDQTIIDVETPYQYRYRQLLTCDKPGLTNKTFRFEQLPPDTNVMLRALQGEHPLTELLLPSNSTSWTLNSKVTDNTIEDHASFYETISRYIVLGVEHILIGIDHLLFLCMLMLIAPWGRRLILLITCFTIGHSITLALATFKVVHLPIPPVEATIALSILFLATEIIRYERFNKPSLTFQHPGIVTLLFGLIHGFGFASVLSDLGLSDHSRLVGLVGFNLGVEIGQIFFAAAVLLIGYGLKQIAPRVSQLKLLWAYVAGSIGSFWLFERALAFTLA